jgi:hypothetical protein
VDGLHFGLRLLDVSLLRVGRERPVCVVAVAGVVFAGKAMDFADDLLEVGFQGEVGTASATTARAWSWSSTHWWAEPKAAPDFWRRTWYPRPENWLRHVNHPQNEDEPAALRRCVQRGCPFDREPWVKQIARKYDLEYTLRPRGHPKTHE